MANRKPPAAVPDSYATDPWRSVQTPSPGKAGRPGPPATGRNPPPAGTACRSSFRRPRRSRHDRDHVAPQGCHDTDRRDYLNRLTTQHDRLTMPAVRRPRARLATSWSARSSPPALGSSDKQRGRTNRAVSGVVSDQPAAAAADQPRRAARPTDGGEPGPRPPAHHGHPLSG